MTKISLKQRKTLKLIEKDMNEKWGEGTVALTISEQYRNMAEIIATCMHLIDNAKKRVRMQMWHHLYFRSAAAQTAVS